MNYVVSVPCGGTTTTSNAVVQGVYDVRWHIQTVGTFASPSASTYMLTVGAKLTNAGTQGNMFFSAPLTLRLMSGN
jgi:hypothetical protein